MQVQKSQETEGKPSVPTQDALIPLRYRVKDAARVSGLSESNLYSLMARGKLTSISVGRRRLICAESLRKLLQVP